jgi:hypothetical protein
MAKAMKVMKRPAAKKAAPKSMWARCPTSGGLKEIQVFVVKGAFKRITAFWGGNWWQAKASLRKKTMKWQRMKQAKWMSKYTLEVIARRPAARRPVAR